MMPKIELEDILKHMRAMQDKMGVVEATDIIHEEQGINFITGLLLGSKENPDTVKGIIVCYLAIRDKLIAKGVDELEKLFKL